MRSRLVLLGLVCTLLVAAPVPGADAPFADAWRWSHFTTADGLPSNFVTSAVDVPGDTLWVVTRRGLARFDGYRWQPVLLPNAVNDGEIQLIPAGDGQVLALSNGLLFAGRRGVLKRVLPGPGPRPVLFTAGARGKGGPVLLLSEDGQLYEWNGTTVRPHETGLALGHLSDLRQAGRGMAWVSGERGLASWDGGRWRLRLTGQGLPYYVLGLVEATDESAWAYVERPAAARGFWQWPANGGAPRRSDTSPVASLALTTRNQLVGVHLTGDLSAWRSDTWVALTGGYDTRLVDARSLALLLTGDVAVATDHGLFLYRESSTRWTVHALPPPDDGNAINEITRGADGSVWLGTSRGLGRLLADGRLEVIQTAGGERLPSVTGLAFDRQHHLWISSGSGFRGVRWRDAQGWHRLVDDPLLDASYVHRIVVDREGNLWFLAISDNADRSGRLPTSGPGAFRLGLDGRISRWGEPEGLPSGRVYAFDQGRDGAYWFGTALGLSRWSGNQWRHWTSRDGLRSNRVFTLAVDAENQVWFGHQTAGLGCLRQERISYLPVRDHYADDAVWNVRVDARGRLWVVAEGGVSVREQGRWISFDAGAGLPNTRVWPVLPEADRAYLGTTGTGVVVLRLSAPSPPPIVSMDRPIVEADAAVVRWRAFSWWAEVAPDAIPTRMQLDDGDWSAWTTEREHRYSWLTPGQHRVRVQAKGLLGTPGPITGPVLLTIAPPLYLRPVVYLPMAALGLVIAGLLTLLVIRQRQHHLALHQREALFTKVFNASPLPTAITRMDNGVFADANAAFERLTGRSRQVLLGRTADDLALLPDDFRHADMAGPLKSGGAVRGMPVTLRDAEGRPLEVVAYLEKIELAGRDSVLAQVIDVTEQRRLEAQLRQAQKMESVGRLAGGVAHDFNNLLTVIQGNASLLDGALTTGDPRREEIEQIKVAAERAERLIRQLLTFARKQVVEPRVVNVNDVVLRTDRMLRRLIGEDIELETITPDVWPVFIDPGQLDQVLLNMAVNARDAMPTGGKLTIRTSNLVIRQGEVGRDPETRPGPYVRLSITDSGVGMDAKTAARVFDPFFTTKEAGKGTGLGLAMCYGVVKQAGGELLVESAPGVGTTFHVDLPRAAEPAAVTEPRERATETPGGQERILLVEDEAQVRRLAASVLRQRGYQVLEAAGGPEAVEMARSFNDRIDVLVTDVVMPQMRGTEVARALRGMRSDIKVLYMSGYTDDERFRQEAGTDGFAFLAKPFTPGTLARRVREVLDAAGGEA